jgi:DNA end-binding protein Ku
MAKDPVQSRLVNIIKSRGKKGRTVKKPATAEPAETPSNVIDLMDALKKSVGRDRKRRKG